jgi:hypothetical protein
VPAAGGNPWRAEAARRVARRPHPRLAAVTAAAGCALAVFGTLTIGGDALADDGDGSQLPGIALCLLLLIGGLVLVSRSTGTAFRTAGSFAAVAAVPPLVFFLTFGEGRLPPYNTEAILFVSAAAWLAYHFAGPTAGRTVPLGAGLVATWLLVLQLIEEPFTAPFDLVESIFAGGPGDGDLGGSFVPPDLTAMGFVSLFMGVGFGALGLAVHRRDEHGRATAFAGASAVILTVAVLLLAPDLETTGTGLLLLVLGLAVAVGGAAQARRFTTWFGGFGCFAGATLLLEEAVGDGSATLVGFVSMVTGAVVVVGGHLLARALAEPDEVVEVPSPFPGGDRGPTAPVTEF